MKLLCNRSPISIPALLLNKLNLSGSESHEIMPFRLTNSRPVFGFICYKSSTCFLYFNHFFFLGGWNFQCKLVYLEEESSPHNCVGHLESMKARF